MADIRIDAIAISDLPTFRLNLVFAAVFDMNNRSELQAEYFKLIRMLNRTNLKKDQKTEIKFLIRSDNAKTRYLVATTNNEKYLRIGRIDNRFQLVVDIDLEFQDFGRYLKNAITHTKNENDLILAIRFAINRLFAV